MAGEESNEGMAQDERVEAALSAALGLTGRQAAIMRCLLAGSTNKQIGSELGISPYTVRDHIANLMHKLRASSRHELKKIAAAVVE